MSMSERRALTERLGPIWQSLCALLIFLRHGLVQTFAFQLSTAVVGALVISPQGQELVRISNEMPATLEHALLVGCIPLLFAVATGVAAVVRPSDYCVTSSPALIPRGQSTLRVLALIAICLPMPALLVTTIRWDPVYAIHTLIGGVLISAIGIARRVLWLVVFGVAAIGLLIGFGVFLIVVPSGAGAVGTLGVTVIALALWSCILTILIIVVPRTLSRFPQLQLAYLPSLLLVGAWGLITLPPPSPEREAQGTYREPAKEGWHPDYSSVQAYFLDWLEARVANLPADQPVPVYLVAAEGGGLRAAAWTTALLNAFDVNTNGKFFDHLFAISGVSGGAVGIAYYAECRLHRMDFSKCGTALIRRDFLAPAVARLLLVEPLRLLLPFRSVFRPRDRLFEAELARTTEAKSPSTRIGEPMNVVFNLLERSARSPIVVLNTTDAHSGRRVYFSNIDLQLADAMHAHAGVEPANSVPLSFAMHTSARFPLLSPPAIYGGWVLVDGGYRENIGLLEVEAVLRAIERVIAFAEREPRDIPPVYATSFSSESALADAKVLFGQHVRARRLLPTLRRLQVHIVAVTNSEYTRVATPEYPELLGSSAIATASPWDDLLAPIDAILASRVSRTRDSIRRLSADLERPSVAESEPCERQLTRSAERLGKLGSAAYLAAREFHYEETSVPCDVRAPRHTLQEASLQFQIQEDLPALGWVLSSKSHDVIRRAATVFEQGDSGPSDKDFTWSPWFEQLVGNLCGGVGSGDIVGRIQFDSAGKHFCKLPPYRSSAKPSSKGQLKTKRRRQAVPPNPRIWTPPTRQEADP